MRRARRDRRNGDLPAVRVLYHLVLLQSTREPEPAFSALAQGLALLARHRAVRLRYRHGAMLLRAVGDARGIGRRAIARGRRVVRSRGRCRGACFKGASEERLAVAVLTHAAAAARTGCPCAGPRVNGGSSSDAWLVTVRGDLGSREVRVTGMPDHPVRIEVAIEVVSATAVATPAEQTDEKDGDQTSNTTGNATNDCSGITAALGTGRHRRCDDDSRLDGGGNCLTIGSGGHEYRRKNRSRCARDSWSRIRSMLSAPIPDW